MLPWLCRCRGVPDSWGISLFEVLRAGALVVDTATCAVCAFGASHRRQEVDEGSPRSRTTRTSTAICCRPMLTNIIFIYRRALPTSAKRRTLRLMRVCVYSCHFRVSLWLGSSAFLAPLERRLARAPWCRLLAAPLACRWGAARNTWRSQPKRAGLGGWGGESSKDPRNRGVTFRVRVVRDARAVFCSSHPGWRLHRTCVLQLLRSPAWRRQYPGCDPGVPPH